MLLAAHSASTGLWADMSMILIQRQVLSSSAASVTFSNIPQNYKTLRLVASTRTTGTSSGVENMRIQFNGSSTGYFDRLVYGNGTSVLSTSNSNTNTGFAFMYANGGSTTSNTFSNSEMIISNYTSSSNKVASIDSITENNATTAFQALSSNLWQDSSAITSITFTLFTAGIDYAVGSSFSLYGLL